MNSINSIIGMEVCTYLTSDFYRQIYCVPSNLFLCTEENTRIPLLYTLANTEDFLFVSFWHNVPPPTQHNTTTLTPNIPNKMNVILFQVQNMKKTKENSLLLEINK